MTGHNQPLVLLHGWGMHSGVWAAAATDLGSAGHVIAVDLPGYGGRASVSPYTLETLATTIAADLPARFDLCAWSLGGQLALVMAQMMPERVRRLVLVGTNPCFTSRPDWQCATAPAILTQFAAQLSQHYEVTLKRFLALQVHGDAAARQSLARLRALLFVRGRPDQAVLQAGLAILLTADLRPLVAGIAAPTLVIHGEYDQLVPVCAAQWLADNLPDGRLQVISSASHAPFLSHAHAFEAALLAFLKW